MLGSYAPKPEAHVYKSAEEEAPTGVLTRGTYIIKSKFTDDDNNNYLSWNWAIDIKKDWD